MDTMMEVLLLPSALLLLLGTVTALASTNVPMVEVLHVYNTSGIIEAPEDPSGGQWYKPNARCLWILDIQSTEGNEVNIELTLDMVDLGLPYTTIHDEHGDSSAGDFLLIGAGSDILMGDDLMFYGRRSAPKRVVVRSGVAHVYFHSSNVTITNATGFTITYNTTGMATTEPPTTTTPAPPTYSSAIVSIRGVSAAKWFTYNDTFTEAISRMASNYTHPDLNMTTLYVPPSDVVIKEARTCHPAFCPEDSCVSFNFSLTTLTESDQVGFSKEDLQSMLADPSANSYIEEAFGSDCQICKEDPSMSLLSYILIPLAVVLLGVGITVAAWKLTDRSTLDKAQERYEQSQRDRIEDQRRRSSGDVSILGLGGRSLASQGSRSSRRYTTPFPKPKADDHDADDEQEEEVDTSEFVYFDPDVGMTNPAQFGMGAALPQFDMSSLGTSYTNRAFVHDEGSPTTLQPQQSSLGHGSDSTDSEDSGALTFTPKKNEKYSKFEYPAEVHSPNNEGETVL